MTEEQRKHRARITEAELVLAKQQEILEAYDLVLHDLRTHPQLHGALPIVRSAKAEHVQRIAAAVADLKANAPP